MFLLLNQLKNGFLNQEFEDLGDSLDFPNFLFLRRCRDCHVLISMTVLFVICYLI